MNILRLSPRVQPHLLAHARGGEPVGAQLHQISPACYVTAGAGNAAAGVLDERPDD